MAERDTKTGHHASDYERCRAAEGQRTAGLNPETRAAPDRRIHREPGAR
jgi:hypothetical protein